MTVRQKEIAALIGKSASAISYIKKTNQQEFEVLRLGAAAIKLGITLTQIEQLHTLKQSLKDAA